jgi:hypothetical protein
VKRPIFFVLLSLALVCLLGCSQSNSVNSPNGNYSYSVKAVDESGAVQGATVIAIIDENSDTTVFCDNQGNASIQSEKPLSKVCCVVLGKSGVVDVSSVGDVVVKLTKNPEISLAKTLATLHTFGVYSTDGHGDVSFKYQGMWEGYYCTSWLPNLGETTDPNKWSGWNLTDWPAPWKGKKLLVPTRYQLFHKANYGYSISNALFMIALY